MKKMIVILIAGVVVGITISGLYKHFVTDRITDGGGMVNEFANVFQDADTLKSIHWSQSGSLRPRVLLRFGGGGRRVYHLRLVHRH